MRLEQKRKLESKKIYHGSCDRFSQISLDHARPFKDFGKGIYLTSDYRQAQRWAQRRADDRGRTVTYIYGYHVEDDIPSSVSRLELLEYDRVWLDIVVDCRLRGYEPKYDIIYDRIADRSKNEIADVLYQYQKGKMSAEDAINKIRWYNLKGDQYCFKTERAVGLLHRTETIILCKRADMQWEIGDMQ